MGPPATRPALLGVVLLLLPCACRAPRGAPLEVTFWAMGEEGEAVKALATEFEARSQGIRVRVQQIPWSAAHEKLMTAFAGGALPDVVQLGDTWIAEFVALGALDPVDALLAAAPGDPHADLFPGVLDADVVDGKTWAMPWYVDTRLLYYRSDLLARAGIAGPPRTWDDWLAAMEGVRRVAGDGAYAILLPLSEWEAPVILGMQRGATLLRDGDRYGDFQSAAFRAAFSYYLDLFRRDLAPRGGEAQAGNLYQGFAEGLFSFVVSGPWNLGEFARRLPAELQGSWSTAPLPAPAAGDPFPGLSIAGGASLALSRNSPRKEAAWRWIEFLLEPAQQVAFQRATGDLPASRRAWRDGGIAEEPRAHAFLTQLERVRPTPKVPEWEQIAALVARHAEAAVRGGETVDQALTGLDADTDRVLEKRRWLLDRRASGAESAAP